MKMLWIGAGLLVASLGIAAAAAAYAAPGQQAQATPKGWNYEIKDGKRVPKGNRVTNAAAAIDQPALVVAAPSGLITHCGSPKRSTSRQSRT